MRTPATLATLLLGLTTTAALIVSPANAGHLGGGTGHGGSGSGDGTTAPPTFVVTDCADLACDRDPQQVGTVVDVKSCGAHWMPVVGAVHRIKS